MRYALLILLIFVSPLVLLRPASQTLLTCDERAFDAALDNAQPGERVIVDCSGEIVISHTKTLSKDLTIEGHSPLTRLIGAQGSISFRIERGTTVTIRRLALINAGIENQGALNVDASSFEAAENGIVNTGAATVERSRFTGNTRSAIFNAHTLTVRGSLFIRNARGLDNASGEAVIANSTFYANKVPRPHEIGGAIANSGSLTVLNSTFSDNDAPGGGSAIGNHGSGVVRLANSILAGSKAEWVCFGVIGDGGHNLQFPGDTCGATIASADPKLLPLAENAELTPGMALQSDSPAIGAGDKTICAGPLVGAVDQGGAPRSACDIGAVEYSARLLILMRQTHD